MTGGHRHSTDGKILSGDVVVSHVNGTLDFYIIARVVTASRSDLTLDSVSTIKGPARTCGCSRDPLPHLSKRRLSKR